MRKFFLKKYFRDDDIIFIVFSINIYWLGVYKLVDENAYLYCVRFYGSKVCIDNFLKFCLFLFCFYYYLSFLNVICRVTMFVKQFFFMKIYWFMVTYYLKIQIYSIKYAKVRPSKLKKGNYVLVAAQSLSKNYFSVINFEFLHLTSTLMSNTRSLWSGFFLSIVKFVTYF